MNETTLDVQNQMVQVIEEVDFSGVILASKQDKLLLEMAAGFANKSDQRHNQIDTRFGIASGCKIFTAVGICKLIEKGRLSFNTTLKSVLPFDFPQFDDSITIHHLLTHTSGVPDYFDEETMDDFADLWKERPMYLLRNLVDFLPMFQHQPMKFSPGERFHYNNAGYILLGLVIEEISGKTFRDYITEELFQTIGMNNSGYFFMDQLPSNTATGYVSENTTNIYSLPIVGGSDGGAFITARDMDIFWRALVTNLVLSVEMTNLLLTPQIQVEEDDYYGYGVWITMNRNEVMKFHVMGYDPGVSYHSGYYPESGLTLVVPSNASKGAYTVTQKLEELLLHEA